MVKLKLSPLFPNNNIAVLFSVLEKLNQSSPARTRVVKTILFCFATKRAREFRKLQDRPGGISQVQEDQCGVNDVSVISRIQIK